MKKTYKKVALIKTVYEEGILQPTLAGHPQLANPSWPNPAGQPQLGTPRANHFLLV
jgi:hypothetical protein